MEQQRYCAFISYRHQSPDDVIAKALHTAIETYIVPANIRAKTGKKRLGRVFRDQEELPLSANLGDDIQAALDESEWFIAICSPRYLESRWCQRELEYFLEKKGRDRVLAVLVEGEPEDSFPERLRFTVDEAGNTAEVEPLAANLRGADWKKKLKDEKLRLLAPMLSVTYDELKQRERQRTLKKAAVVSPGRNGFARRRSSRPRSPKRSEPAPRRSGPGRRRSSARRSRSERTPSSTTWANGWNGLPPLCRTGRSAPRPAYCWRPCPSATRTRACAARSS